MARFLVLRRGWLVRNAVVSLVVACGVMAMYALFAARIHDPMILRTSMGSMREYSGSGIWLVGERSTWGVDECFLQRMSDPTSNVTMTVDAAEFEARWPGVDQDSSIYRIEEHRYGLPFRFLSNTRVAAALANGVINYNSDNVTRVLFVGCCGNVLCVAVGVWVLVAAVGFVWFWNWDRKGLCVVCGYPRGSGGGVCSECGTKDDSGSVIA